MRSRAYFFSASYWLSAEARVGGAALADLLDRGVERLRRDAGVGEDLRGLGVLLDREREQQPLDRDEAVAGLLGDLLGGLEDPGERLREIDLAAAAAGHLGQRRERPLGRGKRLARAAAGALDQARRQPLGVVEQHLQQVLGRELLVAARRAPVCADWMKPRARSV